MSIKATINHSNGKYAVTDNGYILLLDIEGHELKKYPLYQIHLESNLGNYIFNTEADYSSTVLVLPSNERIHFDDSKNLAPFVTALNKEMAKLIR